MSTELITFVTGTNDEPMVSSREVAAKFGKAHKDVLRAYKNLVVDIDDEQFSGRNFALAAYSDEQGKPREEIQMTKDGFALLAMGFTGPGAIVWKIYFLDAFNMAIGSVIALKEENQKLKVEICERDQQIFAAKKLLEPKKPRKEKTWEVLEWQEGLYGPEPVTFRRPLSELKEPDVTIAKVKHIKKTRDGLNSVIEKLMARIGL
jgi:Rha family phage regulatory protein